MRYDNDKIWKESVIIFDSCSILRLYEWYLDKSFELQDIFDCKTQDIILLNQVKKETINVYNDRINDKKNKYINAVDYLLNAPNNEKALRILKKQCDGLMYSDRFILLLKEYIDGKVSYDKIQELVNKEDESGNQYIEENKLYSLFNSFFTQEYNSKIDENELDERFNAQVEKNLPGYKDNGKNINKKGDFIILQQLVEVANDINKNITFVTADVKPDWFPFNKKANKRELSQAVIDWFNSQISNESEINVITLSDMLQIAKDYISDDISSLVDEEVIYDLIHRTYDTWYPEDLIEKVTEYIEENSGIKLEIEDAIDSCLDYIEFGETENYEVKDVIYEIEEDEVVISIFIDFYLTIDATAYCDREHIDLGSPSCHFSGLVKGSTPIDWESRNTGAISIGSQLESIRLEYIDLLSVESLYPEDEEYDESCYEIDDFDDEVEIDYYNGEDGIDCF